MSKKNLEYIHSHIPEGYPRIDKTYDDITLLKHGNRGKEEAKSSVDERLVMLLEFFRQLYIRKREVFKKIFPESQDEFMEMLKKFDFKFSFERSESTTLKRSSSVGSKRTRSVNVDGDELPLRLERFKVRTVVTGGGAPGGDQGETNSGGGAGGGASKSK
ncbi:hypothetical protein JCGZ_01512 [Jatropha curcas]|uniref:Uncharacterized protein n=1 Tax=Jatropha curcas TaxID=180498 RepID=A0A067L9B8_JATCU|nr:uncharacterized protein LOC105648122 [Jatropha curcas]KDP45012.1 hypothetical protein JCGZ_01512 [Jatropha curcas]